MTTTGRNKVQKEKAELEAKENSADDSTTESEGPPSESSSEPPPPASFDMLVTMLASQALMSMGQVPNPATGEPETNKEYARHYIDTLGMLEEKTKGNLSDDEAKALGQTVHQLRMMFLSVN